jgi:hypothetical protein
MNIAEYYSLLGLRQGATITEIKKAYRSKALLYHPDRNKDPQATAMFIKISEAYQYLINAPVKRNISESEREKYYAAWVEYRREEAKKKAEDFARESYIKFKNSDLYKSAYTIDSRMLWFGFGLSTLIIVYTIFGYSYRVSIATCEREMPSVLLALLTLTIGIVFLSITMLYFLAWRADKKKQQDRKENEHK